MSGIAGITHLDGGPVQQQLLPRMADTMSKRNPDGGGISVDHTVGLVHVRFHTLPESLHERQPLTLDEKVWIVADARIDGRTELLEKIAAGRSTVLENPTEAELILCAYLKWGENSLRHLIGDFVFAIWDSIRQRLFCARDHFGVKPFYYAQTRDLVVFANDVEALLATPEVSSELNEQAIGDFLVFGQNRDLATTFYRNIRRLPPAHCLTASRDGVNVRRYWKLPVDGYLRYRNETDYVDHYRDLFQTAVEDRLRCERASVMMSGGTDSTAVAAVASRLGTRVQACTVEYRELLPDDREGHYAHLVSEHTGISIRYLNGDDYHLFERWDEPELYCPEPALNAMLALWFDAYFICTDHSRVVLTGNGGDPVMSGSSTPYEDLLRHGKFREFATSAMAHVYAKRTIRGMGLRTSLKLWLKRPSWQPEYPSWLHPEFASRLQLKERYQAQTLPGAREHPYHADAYAALMAPLWPNLFESDQPLSVPMEVRHPFFDLRLIDYLLAIPPRLCRNKRIHREAMRKILPPPVVDRPKAPLAGNRVLARINHPRHPDTIDTSFPMIGGRYVDKGAYDDTLKIFMSGGQASSSFMNAPVCLDYWLQTLRRL